MANRGFNTKSSPAFPLWIGLSVVIVILDQLSKLVVLKTIPVNTSIKVTDFLNWVLVFNSGAAFSFLADGSGWQKWFLIAIGVIAVLVMLWLLKRHVEQTIFCFSIAMILGGAIGNLIDRFNHGAVVDFIDMYYLQYHWPAFNIADSAITIGALCLIFDEFKRVLKQR